MHGPLLLIVGCGLIALALFLLRVAWGAGNFVGALGICAGIALMGLAFISFGLLLLTESLAVAGPLLVAVSIAFGLWLLCNVCGPRHFRWISYLSGGAGGLILVVLLPAGFAWGHLYFRGVPVQAEVVSLAEGPTYDPDDDGYQRFPVTHVTYQFEAEVGGQRRLFRREGELFGRYRKGTGFVRVLHDPADPDHSRMIREFHWTRNGLLAAAVFLALGVGSYLLSRRGSQASTRGGEANGHEPGHPRGRQRQG